MHIIKNKDNLHFLKAKSQTIFGEIVGDFIEKTKSWFLVPLVNLLTDFRMGVKQMNKSYPSQLNIARSIDFDFFARKFQQANTKLADRKSVV